MEGRAETERELSINLLSETVIGPDAGWSRWVEAARLSESWLPAYFAPSFESLDAALSSPTRHWVPLRELLILLANVKKANGGNRPAWVASLEEHAIRVRRLPTNGEGNLSPGLVELPERALLVYWNQLCGLRLELWEPESYEGRGVADPALAQLLERPGIDLAWIASELRSNPWLRSQLQRAELANPETAVSLATILELRLEQADPAQMRVIGNRFRANSLARRLLAAHLGAPAAAVSETRELALTGATVEERLQQFEQYLLSEPWLERNESFVVYADPLSDFVTIQALELASEPSRLRVRRICLDPVARGSSTWTAWLDDHSSDHSIFNSLLGENDLPDAISKALDALSGLKNELPPFRVWRQLYLEVWNVREGIGPADWDYLIRALSRSANGGDRALFPIAQPGTATAATIEQVRAGYRPILAIKATLNDGAIRTYLLQGPDQADDPLAAHTFSVHAARNLAKALGRSVSFSAEVARRESLRRAGRIAHGLAGPLPTAMLALSDIRYFVARRPELANSLVPDEATANQRAQVPGRELSEFTFDARLELISQSIGRIQSLASRIRQLRDINSFEQLPTTKVSLLPLLIQALSRFSQGHPDIEVQIPDIDEPSGIDILGHETFLSEAFDQVLDNAGRELKEQSIPAPRIAARVEISKSTVSIRISDNALPTQVRLIPEPFEEGTSGYHKTGASHGLGLAMVKTIFGKHGGQCELIENTNQHDQRMEGVTFIGVLPLLRGEHQ